MTVDLGRVKNSNHGRSVTRLYMALIESCGFFKVMTAEVQGRMVTSKTTHNGVTCKSHRSQQYTITFANS